MEKLGTNYGGWYLPKNCDLNENSVVYSIGVGEDISFDIHLQSKYKCNIILVDPTKRAILHFEECKKYYEKNKAIKSVKSKYRYIKHKDKTLKKCKEYRDKNKHQYVAYSRFYQQLKRKAVPPWANKNKISWFYKEARRLSEETGIKHHVDHIYPLQSAFLCGLHVETNLQILTLSENLSKGNKTWPGQLDCQKTDKGSLSSSSSSSSSSLSHIIASSISSS